MKKKQPQVLVVEDDLMLLETLREGITRKGLKVLIARDGQEGLEVAEQTKPDIILLDLLMPRMDGMAMLEKMRTTDWGKDIPVIVLTNLNDTKKIADSIRHHAFDYLIKSDWKIKDVIQKIQDRLALS